MGMPLVLFRDCGGKVLLRYVAYIEQKDGMELILLIKSLCDYLVVRVKEICLSYFYYEAVSNNTIW